MLKSDSSSDAISFCHSASIIPNIYSQHTNNSSKGTVMLQRHTHMMEP